MESQKLALSESQYMTGDPDEAEVRNERAALKRPMSFGQQGIGWGSDGEDNDDAEDIMEGEEPDLGVFFSNFPWMNEASQIALCRTYANYLANVIRAKKPKE